ncbi:hypothetical protein GCM10010503_42650 [Streptomyces lucensis JCM 4490]|uniref:Uncharacterized protein n=1 Tax=Streptomyces lucensis JCM 4490 TaxID=1306176 RepID=A0A918MSJ7_9ACTN|nr:hypothetical protein GCM10010503_42650 [Streptomyces lucensis JCM 4490]
MKLAESVYFFTGSTQEVADGAAALATPVPSTAAAPTPAAMTVTRLRSEDVREERDVTRWNMWTSWESGTNGPLGAQTFTAAAIHW